MRDPQIRTGCGNRASHSAAVASAAGAGQGGKPRFRGDPSRGLPVMLAMAAQHQPRARTGSLGKAPIQQRCPRERTPPDGVG